MLISRSYVAHCGTATDVRCCCNSSVCKLHTKHGNLPEDPAQAASPMLEPALPVSRRFNFRRSITSVLLKGVVAKRRRLLPWRVSTGAAAVSGVSLQRRSLRFKSLRTSYLRIPCSSTALAGLPSSDIVGLLTASPRLSSSRFGLFISTRSQATYTAGRACSQGRSGLAAS